jgi:hypothetical protein
MRQGNGHLQPGDLAGLAVEAVLELEMDVAATVSAGHSHAH